MKYLAVLLCMSGMAAVCIGQTTVDATTADATTVDTTDATTVSVPVTPTPTVSGASAAPGTGPTDAATTNAGGGGATGGTAAPGTTAASQVTCLSCTGNETTVCGGGVSANIATVSCDACWVYRDENTTSNEVTITRGCAQGSDTCNADAETEFCNSAANSVIRSCRRCCTLNECNDETLGVTGNGAADVHVSIVVTTASALFAILSLWQ